MAAMSFYETLIKQKNSAKGLSSKTRLKLNFKPVSSTPGRGLYFIEQIPTLSTVNEFIPRLENASYNRHILELLLKEHRFNQI
jgi:hypothetical protein